MVTELVTNGREQATTEGDGPSRARPKTPTKHLARDKPRQAGMAPVGCHKRYPPCAALPQAIILVFRGHGYYAWPPGYKA
jgi:hypothetical protein